MNGNRIDRYVFPHSADGVTTIVIRTHSSSPRRRRRRLALVDGKRKQDHDVADDVTCMHTHTHEEHSHGKL